MTNQLTTKLLLRLLLLLTPLVATATDVIEMGDGVTSYGPAANDKPNLITGGNTYAPVAFKGYGMVYSNGDYGISMPLYKNASLSLNYTENYTSNTSTSTYTSKRPFSASGSATYSFAAVNDPTSTITLTEQTLLGGYKYPGFSVPYKKGNPSVTFSVTGNTSTNITSTMEYTMYENGKNVTKTSTYSESGSGSEGMSGTVYENLNVSGNPTYDYNTDILWMGVNFTANWHRTGEPPGTTTPYVPLEGSGSFRNRQRYHMPNGNDMTPSVIWPNPGSLSGTTTTNGGGLSTSSTYSISFTNPYTLPEVLTFVHDMSQPSSYLTEFKADYYSVPKAVYKNQTRYYNQNFPNSREGKIIAGDVTSSDFAHFYHLYTSIPISLQSYKKIKLIFNTESVQSVDTDGITETGVCVKLKERRGTYNSAGTVDFAPVTTIESGSHFYAVNLQESGSAGAYTRGARPTIVFTLPDLTIPDSEIDTSTEYIERWYEFSSGTEGGACFSSSNDCPSGQVRDEITGNCIDSDTTNSIPSNCKQTTTSTESSTQCFYDATEQNEFNRVAKSISITTITSYQITTNTCTGQSFKVKTGESSTADVPTVTYADWTERYECQGGQNFLIRERVKSVTDLCSNNTVNETETENSSAPNVVTTYTPWVETHTCDTDPGASGFYGATVTSTRDVITINPCTGVSSTVTETNTSHQDDYTPCNNTTYTDVWTYDTCEVVNGNYTGNMATIEATYTYTTNSIDGSYTDDYSEQVISSYSDPAACPPSNNCTDTTSTSIIRDECIDTTDSSGNPTKARIVVTRTATVSCTTGVETNASTTTAIYYNDPACGTTTPVTVSVNSRSVTYNGQQQSLTATVTPVVSYTLTYEGINGTTYGPSITPPTNVGEYRGTATVTDTAYTGSATGLLTIQKAPLTASTTNLTRTYGAANPTPVINYSGFVNGETTSTAAGFVAPTATISATATATANAGTIHAITLSGGAANNYAFTLLNGTLTITQATLTATAQSQSRTYGAANPAMVITYTGFVNGETTSTAAGFAASTATHAATATATANAGTTHTITTAGGSSTNYAFSRVNGTLTITQATLTATAQSQSRTYGATNPATVITYSGFLNGETTSTASGFTPATATHAASATATANAGSTHTITVSGGSSTNYAFSRVNGTLTITQATLTATAQNQSRIYGATNPATVITYSGFVNGETTGTAAGFVASTATHAATATATANAGTTHTITTAGGSSTNYTFSRVNGTLTITQATLTATAQNQSRTYGDANPATVITYSGFVNGETTSTAAGFTPATASHAATATATANAGTTHAITVSGGSSTNYAFSRVNGTLSITQAILTLSADNKSKSQGSANPALTFAASGFKNADTLSALTGSPSLSTTATTPSPVGTYPITITTGSLTAVNYTFLFSNGILTVTEPVIGGSITITASPAYTSKYNTDLDLTSPVTLTVTISDSNIATNSGVFVTAHPVDSNNTQIQGPVINEIFSMGDLGNWTKSGDTYTTTRQVTVTQPGKYYWSASYSIIP